MATGRPPEGPQPIPQQQWHQDVVLGRSAVEKENTPKTTHASKTAIILGLPQEARVQVLTDGAIQPGMLSDVKAENIPYDKVNAKMDADRRAHYASREQLLQAHKDLIEREKIDVNAPDFDYLLWRAATKERLQEAGQEGNEEFLAVLQRFGIDPKDREHLTEQIDAFYDKNFSGGNDLKMFAARFVGMGRDTDKEKSDTQLLKELDAAKPLLGVWGGKEAQQEAYDAILLEAGIMPNEAAVVGQLGEEEIAQAQLFAKETQTAEDAGLAKAGGQEAGKLINQQIGTEEVKENMVGVGATAAVMKEVKDREEEAKPGTDENIGLSAGLVAALVAGEELSRKVLRTSDTEADEPEAHIEQEAKVLGTEGWIAARIQEVLGRPENAELKKWYEEQLANSPEQRTEDSPLTGQGKWEGKYVDVEGKNQVDRIEGEQFIVVGKKVIMIGPDGNPIMRKVKSPDGQETEVPVEWNQPFIENKGVNSSGEPVELKFKTPQGEVSLNIHGYVALLVDEENKVAVTLANEPAAQTPKRVLVRTPLQSSVVKLQQVLDGDISKDPILAQILPSILPEGKTFADLIADGTIQVKPLLLADANRIDSRNVTFELHISNEARDALIADGKIRMVNGRELKALAEADLMNGHLATALAVN